MEARANDHFSYTPAQAALILRVSPTRVRQLLQGGELEGERDEAGHWLIPAHSVHHRLERLRRESFLEAIGYDPLSVVEMRELVEDLREQVRYLRSLLSEERDARRRADTIIAQLTQAIAALITQRIPEIEAPSQQEAPQEPPGYARSAAVGPTSGEPRRSDGGAKNGTEEGPWWRRILEGRRER